MLKKVYQAFIGFTKISVKVQGVTNVHKLSCIFSAYLEIFNRNL